MSPTDTFIEKARRVHGDAYGYQHTHYINARSKITIYCSKHGPFEQTANNHLNGQGCPECARQHKIARIRSMALTTDEFIGRANVVHQHMYDYTNTAYVSSNKPIVITCPTHGDFVIRRAEKHLTGQGCPTCSRRGSLAEEIIKTWLCNKELLFHYQYTFDDCRSPRTNRKLPFDFFIPTHNLIIEYDGEQHMKKSPLFHPGDRFERMAEHDVIKNTYAHNRGIKILRIRYSEFKNINTILENALS